MVIRACSADLATALEGGAVLYAADLFEFHLVDGLTVYYGTSWDKDLTYNGNTYLSKAPWLSRSKWNVSNTMEVPTMTVNLLADNRSYQGGANIKAQIGNGLFDGASFIYSTAFMTEVDNADALGAIEIFGGVTAAIDVIGNQATITCKGKNNLLDQNAPRNIYQVQCNHSFCDSGCKLSRATFTHPEVVGSSPTALFIPWTGAAPTGYTNFIGGWVAITSGPAAGQRRTIQAATTSGLTLSYPFYSLPEEGDAFSASEGCDKSSNSGSGRSCSDRSNLQNYRGFEFVPPPNTAW